jgi:beta-glucosidase
VYVRGPRSAVEQPDKQLRDFAKLDLRPGETKTVRFVLPPRAFAYWDTRREAWFVEPGPHEILVGASSRDIRLTSRIRRDQAVLP